MNDGKIIYEAQNIPLYQSRLYDSFEEAIKSPLIDVQLLCSRSTGLISNIGFDYKNIVYDQNYNNDQSCSHVFSKHLDEVSKIIFERMPNEDYVEVGCGQGIFLEIIENAGKKVVGFDPSYKGQKKNIEKRYFKNEKGFGKANVIMRHVLEHIPDPFCFLERVKNACRGGHIYIEVPSFEWILKNNAWYDITGEHCNYFTINYFKSIFSDIFYIENTFGGQYISMVASLNSLQRSKYCGDEINIPFSFGPPKLFDTLNSEFYVWGAAGKGVIFCNYACNHGLKVKGLIDINGKKIGKRIAGTGHLISSPNSVLSEYSGPLIVMNKNYRDEINDICNGKNEIICF